MFGIFKKGKWELRSVQRLVGSYNDIRVELNDFPYRINLDSGRRKLPGGDFGSRFITQLTERVLPEFNILAARLRAGETVQVQVRLEELAPIGVTVSGKCSRLRGGFYSDLADALLQAFRSESIG